ncbi:hypothetical protein D9M71_396520 [compost metagenome]
MQVPDVVLHRNQAAVGGDARGHAGQAEAREQVQPFGGETGRRHRGGFRFGLGLRLGILAVQVGQRVHVDFVVVLGRRRLLVALVVIGLGLLDGDGGRLDGRSLRFRRGSCAGHGLRRGGLFPGQVDDFGGRRFDCFSRYYGLRRFRHGHRLGFGFGFRGRGRLRLDDRLRRSGGRHGADHRNARRGRRNDRRRHAGAGHWFVVGISRGRADPQVL